MTAHGILLQLTLFCCIFIPETYTVNPVGCGTYEEKVTVPYERFDFKPFAGRVYRNNLQCTWTFYTPNSFSRTNVQIIVLSLQQSYITGACKDYFTISLFNTTTGTLLDESQPICGTNTRVDRFFYYGENLVISFKSDSSWRYQGIEVIAISTVLKECDVIICPTIQISYDQSTSFSSFTGFYNYSGEFNGRPSYTHQHGGARIRYTRFEDADDMIWALVDSENYVQAHSNNIKYQCPYAIPKISWFLLNSNGYEKVDIASDWNIACSTRCAPLRTPDNAELVFRGDNTVGSSTVFRCLYNYTMLGDSKRVCLQNSTWTGKELGCKADCVQPENGNNSQIRKNSWRYLQEDVVLYDCYIGFFYSSGNRQRMCQPNGTWSGEPLHCTEGCQFPNPGNNSLMSASNKPMHYPIGSNVTYQCLKGFVPFAGNQTRTCLSTTAWSGMSLSCVMPTSKEAESMKADIQTAAIASTMGVLVVIGIIIAVFLIRRLVQNSEDKHPDAKFTNSQHPSGAAFEQSIYSNEICLEQMHATDSGNKATTELPTPSKNQDRSPSQNIDDSYTKVYKPARQDQDSISDRYDALYELENPTIKTGENEYFSIIESDTNTAQQKQTAPDPSNVVMVENDIYDRGVDDDYTSSTTLVENDLYNA